jgi:hypothetical protein
MVSAVFPLLEPKPRKTIAAAANGEPRPATLDGRRSRKDNQHSTAVTSAEAPKMNQISAGPASGAAAFHSGGMSRTDRNRTLAIKD